MRCIYLQVDNIVKGLINQVISYIFVSALGSTFNCFQSREKNLPQVEFISSDPFVLRSTTQRFFSSFWKLVKRCRVSVGLFVWFPFVSFRLSITE